MFFHNTSGKIQDFFCCSRIQCCCVFIQKQKFGWVHSGHQKSQCLSLSSGKKSYRLAHTCLQSDIQKFQFFMKTLFFLVCYMRKPPAFSCCQCQIFFDSHSRSCSTHGILIKSSDASGSCMLWCKRNISAIQFDRTGICKKISTDGIKKCGFACTIGTNNRSKITFF